MTKAPRKTPEQSAGESGFASSQQTDHSTPLGWQNAHKAHTGRRSHLPLIRAYWSGYWEGLPAEIRHAVEVGKKCPLDCDRKTKIPVDRLH